MAKIFKTSVFRYNPDKDDEPYFQEFDVDYEPGMTVLDALLFIQDKYDSSLAFRWECRGGQCGSCAVRVNKTARIACRTKVEPDEKLVLEPLEKMPVIKDLVTDISQVSYRLRRIRPYVARDKPTQHPEIIHSEEIEKVREIRKCIECSACLSNCPIVHETWDYPGPMIIRQLARLELDPRDVEDRVAMAMNEMVYTCTTCKMCEDICPKSIKPGPEMQKYEEEIARYQTFLKLCDEILQVNEQICDARPVGEIGDEKELEELKKKLLKKYKGKYRKK